MKKRTSPKILLVDIETAPILAYVWRLFDENVGLNQIKEDWHLLSWSAKWLHDPPSKLMYEDQSKEKDISDDKKLLQKIWKLLDKADIAVMQNGVKFDRKKLNARFVINGMKPPSPYKIIDTYLIARKHFGFTSNKLEYLSDKLAKKYKKLTKQRKFPGFELWKECLAGNKAAWKEMKLYNGLDILAMEEVFITLYPWENNINFNLYNEDGSPHTCNCGSNKIRKKGYSYTATSKYQRYLCLSCGANMRDRVNLLSKDAKKKLKVKVNN